jgi:hypothetical protein
MLVPTVADVRDRLKTSATITVDRSIARAVCGAAELPQRPVIVTTSSC